MLRSKHPRNRVSIAYCNTDEIRNKKKGKYKMTMIILDTISKVHTCGINRLYSSNERKLMDKQLLLIILVGLVFAIWEYIKHKRQKELDERLQKHLWKYFNEKH
jgi:hypothetical protein